MYAFYICIYTFAKEIKTNKSSKQKNVWIQRNYGLDLRS